MIKKLHHNDQINQFTPTTWMLSLQFRVCESWDPPFIPVAKVSPFPPCPCRASEAPQGREEMWAPMVSEDLREAQDPPVWTGPR